MVLSTLLEWGLAMLDLTSPFHPVGVGTKILLYPLVLSTLLEWGLSSPFHPVGVGTKIVLYSLVLGFSTRLQGLSL